MKKLCDSSRIEASKAGTNIAFVGPTGDGKTTTASGFTMYLIEFILYECNRRMNDIRVQLKDINFNRVISIFTEKLSNSYNLIHSLNFTVDYFIKTEKSLINFNHDYLNLELKRNLLRDYILYFFCINIRKKFVFSKGYFFDRVSGEISNYFDDSSVELRNVLDKHNFQLDLCNIIFNDEVSLNRGNALSSNLDVKLSGATEFLALIRNMFQGLTFNINTKQVSDNQVRQERLLINSTFQIFDRKVFILNFTLIQKIADLYLNFIKSFYKISFCFINLFRSKDKKIIFDVFLNEKSYLRKIEFNIFYFKKILNAQSFIRVRLFKYYSSEDVSKRTKGTYDCVKMYFPIYYCYGLTNTYEYYESAYPIFNAARENGIYEEISKSDITNRSIRIKNIFTKKE